jgi:hypothetical protein
VRDRLLAGAMIPAGFVVKAQIFRRWFQAELRKLFQEVDFVLAPATPCKAPRIGQTTMTVGGETLPVRANLGLFTQPLSFIGLPVATVPVWTNGERLPIGVQVVGAAWREDHVLRGRQGLGRGRPRGIGCRSRTHQDRHVRAAVTGRRRGHVHGSVTGARRRRIMSARTSAPVAQSAIVLTIGVAVPSKKALTTAIITAPDAI